MASTLTSMKMMRACPAKAGLDHSAVLLLHLLSLSSTESSAREISSMRNTPPSFMASTRGPSCHWNSLPSSPADCTDKNDYTFSCTVLEGNQHGGAASRYLMCVPDGSEASQEVGRLHVQVAVDREEPVTGQRGKQLADCRLSTAAAKTGGSRRSVSVISPSWRSNPSRARVSGLTRCLRPAAPTRRIEAPVPPAPPAASWPESTPRGGTPPGRRRCCQSGDLASRRKELKIITVRRRLLF